jgi:LacI family transcriptional regulator
MASKNVKDKAEASAGTRPIAMVFDFDRSYASSAMCGISRYAHECDNWALVIVSPHRRLLEALRTLDPAGILVNNTCPGIVNVLRKIGRPVVNMSLLLTDPHFHQVTRDDASIGIAAANHLIDRGLKNFGYFGPPWDGPDSNREGGFHQTLKRHSLAESVFYVRPSGSDPTGGTFASHKQVRKWVRSLPKPVGVFAPYDVWALWLCGVCRQEGIKVPQDVAVIGAENNEQVCELAQPTLSSIAIPAEQIGYEAAAMLDKLMNHKPVPKRQLLLPAIGVVTRQSTDMLAVTDPDLLSAVEYMREHIAEPITIDDVMKNIYMPRRSFERKFRAAMRRSPAQELRRMRVALAATLLTSTPRIKIEHIIKRCGFASSARFFIAFHQVTGLTPADYRRTMERENGKQNAAANFASDSAKKR